MLQQYAIIPIKLKNETLHLIIIIWKLERLIKVDGHRDQEIKNQHNTNLIRI